MNHQDIHLDQVRFDKSRFRRYIGNIGEMVVQEVLLDQGFQVWLMTPYFPNSFKRKPLRTGLIDVLGYLRTKESRYSMDKHTQYGKMMSEMYEDKANELKDFFGDKLEAFWQYVEKPGIPGKRGIPYSTQGLRDSFGRTRHEYKYIYCPDLLAKKQDKIYVVEIKVGQGINYLKGGAMEGLMLAKDYGFIPLLA